MNGNAEKWISLTSDEQFGYAREPIIQRMPDGSIVCLTLTGGPTEPHKTNVVGVVRSEDDGKSWSRHTTLFQHSERACWAPEMYVEGDVVCVLVHTYNSECRYRELIVFRCIGRNAMRPGIGLKSRWKILCL